MTLKKLHFFSGLIITLFTGLHLFNHLLSVLGVQQHIQTMNALRPFYRNPVSETILLLAVGLQIISGIKLFISKKKWASSFFDKLQIWTGFYLAIFFLFHVGAVMTGRYFLKLDTNFYFGAAGLNAFPFNLFFIPYYSFAILSFFGHLAAIHVLKNKLELFGLSPKTQGKIILGVGFLFTIGIMQGLTNNFKGVNIPNDYGILIGNF